MKCEICNEKLLEQPFFEQVPGYIWLYHKECLLAQEELEEQRRQEALLAEQEYKLDCALDNQSRL